MKVRSEDAVFVILPCREDIVIELDIEVPSGVLEGIEESPNICVLGGKDTAFEGVFTLEDGITEELEIDLFSVLYCPVIAELQPGEGNDPCLDLVEFAIDLDAELFE
jgi:hypothetical protein